MDSKSSIQSKKPVELDNVNCGLDCSLLLVARFDRVLECVRHTGLVAFSQHLGRLRSDLRDLERGWKRFSSRDARVFTSKTYPNKTR